MTFKIGPFILYRCESDGTLDISLAAFENQAVGWEYGWDDALANREPWIEFRIGKLMVIYFEGWIFEHKIGFEIWFLGFWWIF